MTTTLDGGTRSIQIKFSSGSSTLSNVRESVTDEQVRTFCNAVALFTSKTVTGFVIQDKKTVGFD